MSDLSKTLPDIDATIFVPIILSGRVFCQSILTGTESVIFAELFLELVVIDKLKKEISEKLSKKYKIRNGCHN